MYEPKHAAEELTVKLCIELTELAESYKRDPSLDILERIKLKEQLLNELREFLNQYLMSVDALPPGL
jgi:hypothetical protein